MTCLSKMLLVLLLFNVPLHSGTVSLSRHFPPHFIVYQWHIKSQIYCLHWVHVYILWFFSWPSIDGLIHPITCSAESNNYHAWQWLTVCDSILTLMWLTLGSVHKKLSSFPAVHDAPHVGALWSTSARQGKQYSWYFSSLCYCVKFSLCIQLGTDKWGLF